MSQENWDKIFSEGTDFSPLNLILLGKILERVSRIGKTSIKNVVDLGVGTGDSAIKFAEAGFFVQGLDWSKVALEKAEDVANREGVREKVIFTEMDLNNIDTGKIVYNPADVVFTKLVFAFIDDKDKFLDTVKSFMSEDSVLVIMTPVIYKEISYDKEDKPGIAVEWKNVTELLKKKFDYVEEFNHDYFGDKGDLVTFLIKKNQP
ncbi:MAG: class I SAM-dependent methyltransferase [Candidatus Paceibacterota bacterium]